MIREIKFRARHRATGEWWYGSSSMYKQILTICPMSVFWWYYDIGVFVKETLGEHTRLKDKNGKEIYEGDIVRGYLGEYKTMGGSHYITEKIQWCDEGYWEPFVTVVDYDGTTWVDEVHKDMEVIGNIYENPELLEVKDE